MPNFNIPSIVEQATAKGNAVEQATQSQSSLQNPEQEQETFSQEVPLENSASLAGQALNEAEESEKVKGSDYIVDAALMGFRGVEGFAEGVYGLLDFVTGDRLWDWDRSDNSLFGKSKTIPGMLGEGVVQFASAFVPFVGVAGKLGKVTQAGKLATKSGSLISKGVISSASKGATTVKLSTLRKLRKAKPSVRKAAQFTVAGAMADFVAFKGEEARLSNLLTNHKGEDSSALLSYLSYDPERTDNNEIEERFKNVIEGIVVGGVVGSAFVGAKAAVSGLNKTFKVFRDKSRIMSEQKARGEEVDEVEAYAEAIEINAVTPDERKAVRQFESQARDEQNTVIYESVTKRKVSEEPKPEAVVRATETPESLLREEYERRAKRLVKGELGGEPFVRKDLLSFEEWVATGKGSLGKMSGKNYKKAVKEAKKAAQEAAKKAAKQDNTPTAQPLPGMGSLFTDDATADVGVDLSSLKVKRDIADKEAAEAAEVKKLIEEETTEAPAGETLFAEQAAMRNRAELDEFEFGDSDTGAVAEKRRIADEKSLQEITKEKERVLSLPNTIKPKGWEQGTGAGFVGASESDKIISPFFKTKSSALAAIKAEGKNPDDYTVKRVDAQKILGDDSQSGVPKEWTAIKKSDKVAELIEEKADVISSYKEQETPNEPPVYRPIDVDNATDNELDAWFVENLGESTKALDKASKKEFARDILNDVAKGKDSKELVISKLENEADKLISKASQLDSSKPNASYGAVKFAKSVPEVRAIVSRLAKIGATKAGAKKVTYEEVEELARAGIDATGGNSQKSLQGLEDFAKSGKDLRALQNTQEALFGVLEEAGKDIKAKVDNAVEARDNGIVVITEGSVTKKLDYEASMTELFSSMDRWLAVQELWADIGTDWSLGLRMRRDLYETGTTSIGRDIAGQNRRLGFELQGDSVASKTAQRVFRNEVKAGKEGKFLKEIQAITKDVHNVKQMGEGVEASMQSTNAALAKFIPSKRKGMAITQEWFINALLGSPTTWIVNGLGNSLTMALRHFEISAGAIANGNLKLLKAHLGSLFHVESIIDALKYASKSFIDDEAKSIQGHTAFRSDRLGDKAIYSAKGEGPNANGLHKAINWLGTAVRHPTRILMMGDEFFKQLSFRSHTRTMLAVEGYEKGLKGKGLARFVNDGFEGLITSEGRFRNEANVLKEAQNSLAARRKAGEVIEFGQERFETKKYMDEHFYNHELTLEDGSIYKAKDLGQRNQLVEGGTDFALLNTFTNEVTNPAVKALGTLAQSSPWLTFLIPFVRTPSNIITFALGRVVPIKPMGKSGSMVMNRLRGRKGGEISAAMDEKILTSIGKGAQSGGKELSTPAIDAMVKEAQDMYRRAGTMEAADYTGRLATGGMLAVGALYLLENIKDSMTGAAPSDKAKASAWKATGKQPYSIKLGDKWYSYQRLDPFATMLGIWADIIHGFDEARQGERGSLGTEEEIEENRTTFNKVFGVTTLALTNNITNKSYIENLHGLFEFLKKPHQEGEKLLGNVIAGFVPNALNASQNVFTGGQDPAILEARTIMDKVMKKLPEGMRKGPKLMPRRNFLGEVQRKQNVGGLVKGLNPIFSSDVSTDIVDMEIEGHGVGKGHASPILTVGGERLNLREYRNDEDQTAYDRYQELTGKVSIRGMTLRQALKKVIESEEYQAYPEVTTMTSGKDHPRTKIISTLINRYRALAKNEMFKEFTDVRSDYLQLLNR